MLIGQVLLVHYKYYDIFCYELPKEQKKEIMHDITNLSLVMHFYLSKIFCHIFNKKKEEEEILMEKVNKK